MAIGTSVGWIVSIVLMAFAVSFTLRGVYNIAFEQVNNTCAMTYMHPYFMQVTVNQSRLRNKYRLFRYHEHVKEPPLSPFTHIPVLFIHGHAGHFAQVRSLGAEAHAEHSRGWKKAELDYYSVDFKEELSAIDGASLADQTEFVVDVIRHLLASYPVTTTLSSYRKPKSILLIGHSMGGIVARAALQHPRQKKRIMYNRRYVNVDPSPAGKKKSPNWNAGRADVVPK
jgi:glycosylphosphatidylinositol deacylase